MKKHHIVIAGASGAVGQGLAEHFLALGHRLTLVVRDPGKKEKLVAKFASPLASVIVNEFSTEEDVKNLRNELRAAGAADLVIASLGGWYSGGSITDLDLESWNEVIDNGLGAHFRFARAAAPLLAEAGSGTYVLINGGASEFPVPGSGVVSVGAAAQKMLGAVLEAELRVHGVKVYSVAAFDIVRTHRNPDPALWLGTEEIGDYILNIVGNTSDRHWHKLQEPSSLSIGS